MYPLPLNSETLGNNKFTEQYIDLQYIDYSIDYSID